MSAKGISRRSRRVALIGHSGAGKTACLKSLGIDPKIANMDVVVPLKLSKSNDQALETLNEALRWLASDGTPGVVAVRNDEKMLYAMVGAKLDRKQADRFGHVVLVYLHTPLEDIRERLRGRPDTEANEYTIKTYRRFHKELYSKLADWAVECGGKSIEAVAAEVMNIASCCAEGSA